MASRKGAEIIVDALVDDGVPYVFGLCGHGILGFLDAVYDRRDQLKTISVHHEAAAAFMADAYYRVTHRPVATFTSCGPGSVNLLVALASAFADSSPLLAITGNVATSQWNRGPFQETGRYFQGDFVNAVRPYVKRSFQPTRPDMVALAMRQAFMLMRGGRPGPVHLDVPLNVFVETAEVEPLAAVGEDAGSWRSGADPAAVERALTLLLRAERPVIVAGHGVELSEAEFELTHLAETLRIPVVTTPLGKGVIDMRHPLSLGPTGRNGPYAANAATRNADVVLAVGTRFDDRATSAWLPGFTYQIPPTQLVQIDIDPSEMGRNYPVAVGLLGDAKVVLSQLCDAAQATRPAAAWHGEWLDRIEGWRRRWQAEMEPARGSEAVPMRPERLVSELRRALPEDGLVLADVGVHHNWLVSEFVAYRPRSILQSWGYASMGFGVAGVVGAKLGAPDRPAVAVVGDGGFLMMPSAVATAVEYGISAIWLVCNNSGYGSIREQQRGYFGPDREIATSFCDSKTGSLYTPDYAAMARSMGAAGITVERPQDLGEQLRLALASGKPTVLDVLVDRDARLPATGSWDLPPLAPPLPTFGWGED